MPVRGAQGVTSPLAGQMFFRMSLFSVFGGAKRWLGTNPDGSARKLTTADFFKARNQLHTQHPLPQELQQCHDHRHATSRADDRPGWPLLLGCALNGSGVAVSTARSQFKPDFVLRTQRVLNGCVMVTAERCRANSDRQPARRDTADYGGSASRTFGICRDEAHSILGAGKPPYAPAAGP